MPTTVDAQVISDLRAIEQKVRPGMLSNLIDVFLNEAPPLLRKIAEAGNARDSRRIAVAAHTLRSGSAGLGAAQLAELCHELEVLAEHQAPLTRDLYLELCHAYRAAATELSQIARSKENT